jgi:hypothetical protein
MYCSSTPKGPKGAFGGCETDGPLGALAVLRALCARGDGSCCGVAGMG